MNERGRMQYLEAMGIDMFVPRRILPAAKLSVQCVLPQPDVNSVEFKQPLSELDSPASVNAVMEAPSFVKNMLAPTQKPLLKTSADTKPDKGATLQQHLAPKKATQLRFSLSVWQLENGVVIVDSREPKGALPTATLLQNIIKVMFSIAALPAHDLIQWPLIESSVSNENELSDAREMVQAFLVSRFDVQKPILLIVMGAVAKNVVYGQNLDSVDNAEIGEIQQYAHLPCQSVYLPSLADLLRQPLLKHHIWSALSTLIK